jgi:HEXXH motif-containing protein
LLQRVHPIAAAELAVGLSVLVPVTERDQTIPYSASSREAFGSVALSLPIGRAQFAATLVHEFAHSKLSCLMNLVELYERDEEPRFYAPWRDDPRPLGGMLQGTYSYLAITDFWRRHRIHSNGEEQEVAYFHFALARAQATQAARALADDPKLTSLGQRFVSKMLDRLDSWQADPVPADILAKAARASAEHRARWRLRNLQPSAE